MTMNMPTKFPRALRGRIRAEQLHYGASLPISRSPLFEAVGSSA
jgi:hypothetical protein